MARLLTDYLDEESYGDLVLSDPAFFDAAMLRIVQDAELIAFILARTENSQTIDEVIVGHAIEIIGAAELVGGEDAASHELIERYAHQWVRPYTRSPIPITDGGTSTLAQLPASAALHVLRPAAERAREQGTSQITTSHLLPFCEDLPFPLNHWLC